MSAKVGREFYENIIDLGEYVLKHLEQSLIEGTAPPDVMYQMREIKENIKICKQELKRYK